MPVPTDKPFSFLARLDFKRETDEAWNHYKTTGLHVTLQEVGNWMDTLFTENELPPPQCHL